MAVWRLAGLSKAHNKYTLKLVLDADRSGHVCAERWSTDHVLDKRYGMDVSRRVGYD